MRRMTFIILCSLIAGCRPQAPQTQYNQLIDVPDAENASYTTKEDEPVAVKYSVEQFDESMDLEVQIVQQPKHGTLEDCKFSGAQFDCTYTPYKDYNGTDTFKVTTIDGGLKGDAVAVITLQIGEVNDAPTAGAGQAEDLLKNNKLTFHVSKGFDDENLASELEYVIVKNPTNGDLSNCFSSVGNKTCSYTPDANYLGEDELTYKVVDKGGLESEPVTVKITVGDVFFSATETFQQNAKSEIDGFDLVWVIDNSGSMDDEQDELAANTSTFIQKFVDSNIADSDFKMGVTTTEAWYSDAETFRQDNNGNAYDFSRSALKANKSLFIDNFKKAVQIGNTARVDGGNQIEKEFASAERVFNQEAGWYRDNKKALLYIFLTDEKEQSVEKTTAQWLAQFDGLKDSANKVKMFPIYNFAKDDGRRFEQTAAHYGVQQYSVVSSFDSILNDITTNITKLLESFSLDSKGKDIVQDSVTIVINGVNVPRVNAANEVQWTISSNALTFTVSPPADANINVTYKYTLDI